jgi:N-acylglucosamine 2-epimerase
MTDMYKSKNHDETADSIYPLKHELSGLEEFLPTHLLKHVMPFYLAHSIDAACGGFTNCLDNDGNLVSTDKYLWSQGRGLWTFSAIYNRITADTTYLKIAEQANDFLSKFGRDIHGRWAYHVSREGNILEGPISIYADLFVAYGLTEFYRATKNIPALNLAWKTIRKSWQRIQEPDFNDTAPYKVEKNHQAFGVAMIFLDTVQELFRSVDDPELETMMSWSVEQMLRRHYQPEYGLIFEIVEKSGKIIDSTEGRIANPGHTIEGMWFLMHYARRTGRKDLIKQACEITCVAVERGWDAQFGGIYLAIDADTGKPTSAIPRSDRKPWWIHCEALYTLLLAYELTGEHWTMEWFWKIFDWSMRHHVCPSGDWYQSVDRTGKPDSSVVALPVKDPYHLPRSLILCIQSLHRQKGAPTKNDPFENFKKMTIDDLNF